MSISLGIDVGTTTITALALDASTGETLAVHTLSNDAEVTSADDKARGRSEWDADRIAARAGECLHAVAGCVASRGDEFVGLGITGQQHGVVLVDKQLRPLTPLINWQDQRTRDAMSDGATFLETAQRRIGDDAPERTGARLAAGYLGTTLFWLNEQGILPHESTAVFLADYLGARLTEGPPVTDPTNAAGSGLLNAAERQWDKVAIEALGLNERLLPPIAEAGDLLGVLSPSSAASTGLPQGLPVFVALGDHQASVVGSVAERERSVLVNVGTGGQVAGFTDRFRFAAGLETRPYPRGGYLLVSAGLCGGRSYALLEAFFRAVGEQMFGATADAPLYPRLNELAASVPAGADGLRCEPLFTGTRANPSLRGSWSGLSPANFTPAHLARSLLEGMASVFRQGFEQIHAATGGTYDRLIGAGNGLRENAVLSACVCDAFGLPLTLPRHREEAAFGAALIASVGAGVFPDVASAGGLIRYESQ